MKPCLNYGVSFAGAVGGVLLPLVLAACSSLPNARAPSEIVVDLTDVPCIEASEASLLNCGEAPQKWWLLFNDALLAELVSTAVESNSEVALVAARLREVRAHAKVTRSRGKPQVGVSGSITKLRLSENGIIPAGQIPGIETNQVLYDTGFDAVWEFDLLGRQRLRNNIAIKDIELAEYASRDVIVSLTAEMAQAYILWQSTRVRLQQLDTILDLQVRFIKLLGSKLEYGEATKFDLALAELRRAKTEAERPVLITAERVQANRIAGLLGRAPGQAPVSEQSPVELPHLPTRLQIGKASDLLRRRPDVRRAELAYLRAAHARRLSQLDLYPSFILVGGSGFESTELSDLFRAESLAMSLAGIVEWTLYDGGKRAAAKDRADARLEQADIAYRSSVLIALEEVENAIIRFGQSLRTVAVHEQIVAAGARVADYTRQRYNAGVVGLADVLLTESDLADARMQLIQAQTESLNDVVSLYKRLGGGWFSRVVQ